MQFAAQGSGGSQVCLTPAAVVCKHMGHIHTVIHTNTNKPLMKIRGEGREEYRAKNPRKEAMGAEALKSYTP